MTSQELRSKFDKFLTENNGKFIKVLPNNLNPQCFDLAVAWTDLLGVPHYPNQPSPFPYVNAYEIFTKPNSVSSQYFDFIPNSPTAVPQKGDIIVWDKNLNGGIGHVAVATGNGTVSSFESYDQNWVVGSFSKLIQHSYNYVLGWLRLKVTQSTMDKRPGWFDILSKTEFGTTGWEKLTDAQITKWANDLTVRKTGNGKWDQICAKAGLPTSSTPDQVAAKLQGKGFDKNKFLEDVKSLLFQ